MVSNPLNLQSPLIVDVLKGQIEKACCSFLESLPSVPIPHSIALFC